MFTTVKKVDDVINSDVCSPSPTSEPCNKYIATFIDGLSRYVTLGVIKSKSEVLIWYQEVKEAIKRRHDGKSKMNPSDIGGEYVPVSRYAESAGVVVHKSALYISQANSTLEKANCTIV